MHIAVYCMCVTSARVPCCERHEVSDRQVSYGILPFLLYFVLFSYESISWDVQDIDNRQGFLADSPIRAVSMTALINGTVILHV